MATVRVFHDGTLTEPRLDHPEGVAVHPDGSLWCGGERGQLYRVAPDGGSREVVASTGGFVLGVDIDANDLEHPVYLCDLGHRAVYRYAPSTGLEQVTRGGARPFVTPNMVRAAPSGALYVTDSNVQGEPGGGVYRFVQAAPGEPWAGGLWFDEPLNFANGLAVSEDETCVYVVETFAARVVRIPILPDGGPGPVEVVAKMPGVLPDGVTLGPDGLLYVGCYEPSQVLRVDPATGAVSVLVADPTAHLLCHPTNVAFRGWELFTANLGRWHLAVVDLT
ncbi:SMP-30/gluconolactonase/LRE family protein [Ruania halotolerans]|uniref:SMP-30/gluconolactonase/LRE family protein n=1 Tax=Ruania halotolerans TaxID=2897773 RepID=UPI001E32B65F|nr:SMP-30/gluconolactonase/LRE family protein [Ruania halotolerans]UFU07618.1 SMP-30/gluconolactonase/LRE family protein [Ruania halotolerans]